MSILQTTREKSVRVFSQKTPDQRNRARMFQTEALRMSQLKNVTRFSAKKQKPPNTFSFSGLPMPASKALSTGPTRGLEIVGVFVAGAILAVAALFIGVVIAKATALGLGIAAFVIVLWLLLNRFKKTIQ